MSDTLTNALQQSAHNSTVLQGIMNPAQVNPLAGMGSAISAVQGMQGLQEKAAQQAAGQAYQAAINPQTGEFDPNEMRRQLAARGPAAMAAGAALLNTQQISSDQLKQNLDKAKWVNSISGALLQAGDFSDAAMLGALHNGVAGGILTLPEAQRQLATMPADAAGRQRWLQEHQDTSASFQEQMNQRYGTPFRENVGGQIVGGVQNQRGGGSLSTGSGPLTTTMSPDASGQIVEVQIGGNQTIQMPLGQAVPLLTANPNLRALNPNISLTPPASHGFTPYVPPANRGSPRGTPGGPGTYPGGDFGVLPGPGASLGGGAVVASADPAFAPSVGAAAPPSPAVAGDVSTIMAGMNRARATPSGGTRTAFNAIQSGAASAPASGQPPATASPAPNTPLWRQPPPPPVRGGGVGGLGVTAAPGYVEAQRKTSEASTTAYNGLQAQVAATKDVEPILSDMEAQARTPGFETGLGSIVSSTMRQLLQFSGLTSREPGGKFDVSTPEAAKEQFAKDAARLQAAQLGALGNPTDARQELSESTNPGLMLSKHGNLGIIHMLQGNQQAIRAMSGAWEQATQAGWTPDQFNTWTSQRFLARDAETGGRFDPRVFWFANEGGLAEQRKYAANVPEGVQRKQFLSNLQYAKNMGWIRQNPDGSTVVTGP